MRAAVQIVELYNQCDSKDEGPVLRAFGAVVSAMQPKCFYFAYHCIAFVMDWHNRGDIWRRAGLPDLSSVPRCEHEPRLSVAASPVAGL